jgi:predicted nucleic acid-binding Zn ribbon protein
VQWKLKREQRERLIGLVVIVLRNGEPTLFRFEATCRHTLRSALCLRGQSWGLAEAIAANLVCSALERIGAQRPPWLWGQREYLMDSTATRGVGFTHCLNCGTRLEQERFRFCSKQCGGRYRKEFEQSQEALAAQRVSSAAARETYRENARSIRCEACKRAFKPSYPGNRFCSRQCSAGRSFAEKMNGKHHPWLKDARTGAAAANGAGVSSENTEPREQCSAPVDARTAITAPSSGASAPRRAAS